MEQHEGWSEPRKREYRYEFDPVPDSNHMIRRTARRHAMRLNAKHLARGGSERVRFLDEKRKRGPFGWYVVKRTKVYDL
jgi:hypothetical protein